MTTAAPTGTDAKLKKAKLHNKFGSLLQRSGKIKQAEAHFRQALALNSNFATCHFNLANLLQKQHLRALRSKGTTSLRGHDSSKCHYERAMHVRPELAVAWHNLGTALMYAGKNNDGLRMFHSAIKIHPDYPEANFNLATVMRRLGRQNEAIEYTWSTILRNLPSGTCRPPVIDCARGRCPLNSEISLRMLPSPAPSASSSSEQNDTPAAEQRTASAQPQTLAGGTAVTITSSVSMIPLCVVCVKWGTKYDAEYVNKLYRGVQRHLRHKHKFICFTDKKKGLDESIICRELLEGWKGWWNKATLFSPEAKLEGRVFYIDLDTVITGPLDPLLAFDGGFATLSTDDFANEGRTGGFNSSIMLWNTITAGGAVSRIYSNLVMCKAAIGRSVHRFDHWLEMNLTKVAVLQDLFPGVFVEYMQHCQDSVPAKAAVVNFPLEPKPHSLASRWIIDHWF